MKGIYFQKMKYSLFFLSFFSLFLFGCGEKDLQNIEKSDFYISLPHYWEEIHPQNIQNHTHFRALFQWKRDDAISLSSYLGVTREIFPENISALEVLEETKQKEKLSLVGYTLEHEKDVVISDQKTKILRFTAKTDIDAPLIRYWQIFLAKEKTAFVFTIGEKEKRNTITEKQVLEIFKSITLK
jgi:hypothetical protein